MTDFWLFTILLATSVATFKLFKSQIKGVVGEKTIAFKLTRLNHLKYKVINNLVLDVSGKTTQIDHVIISDFGLFVIETKNLKGWIMGFENSEYWTQVIYKRKEKIYNPIRQNLGHIRALEHYLQEFSKVRFIPIVVFSNNCTIKVETDLEVIYSAELLKVIRSYSEVTLFEKDKEAIFERISSVNISSNYKRSAHIKSIKQRIEGRRRTIEQNKCPQCGADLILRNGKFGKFKGCSNFPHCKFTINGLKGK
jgi:predicted RNA-binding Zn-ribbon protein involved in translation (DUF1610 family)